MREHHRRIIDWLTAEGATDILLDPRRRHTHIHFAWLGDAKRYVTSSMPCDSRTATLNALTDLRHMLGLTEPVKRAGMRRQVRRRERERPVSAAPALTAGPDWRNALPDLWPRRGRPFLRRLITGFARFAAERPDA